MKDRLGNVLPVAAERLVAAALQAGPWMQELTAWR